MLFLPVELITAVAEAEYFVAFHRFQDLSLVGQWFLFRLSGFSAHCNISELTATPLGRASAPPGWAEGPSEDHELPGVGSALQP